MVLLDNYGLTHDNAHLLFTYPPFLNSIPSFSSLIPSRQSDLGVPNSSLSLSTLMKQTTFTYTMDIDKPLDEIIDQKRSERRSARGRGRGRGAARGGGAVRSAGAPAGTGPVRNKHTGGAAAAGAAGPAASAPGKPVIPLMADGSKIIVSNLPTDVTENQIRVRTTHLLFDIARHEANQYFTLQSQQDLFTQTVGPVTRVSLSYDKNGKSTGSAAIDFKRPTDAQNAFNSYNTRLVDGSEFLRSLRSCSQHQLILTIGLFLHFSLFFGILRQANEG